jgi:hypothetical protein
MTRHRGAFPSSDRQRLAILEQNFVSTMSLFEVALWERLGGFDPALRHAEDWDFWLRAVFAGTPVHHQPEPTALYRWSTAGLTADRAAMDAAAERVLRKAADTLALSPAERAYVERRLAVGSPTSLLARGDAALRDGRYGPAAAAYGEAAALAPSDRTLAVSARALRLAPWAAGPLLRRRRADRDRLL